MKKTTAIQVRTDIEIKERIESKAKSLGFKSLSEYIIFVALNAEIKVTAKKIN